VVSACRDSDDGLVSEMPGSSVDPLRSLALLDELYARHQSQGFGRVVQLLLALTFQGEGYRVVRNSVGVPDLVATKEDPPVGYAIEVKTGERKISLSPRDIQGVVSTGHVSIVAVLIFPDPQPHWLFLDARSIKAGTYAKHQLARKPKVPLEFDANAAFRTSLAAYHSTAMQGTSALSRAISSASDPG